jgi:hypothetical protein
MRVGKILASESVGVRQVIEKWHIGIANDAAEVLVLKHYDGDVIKGRT